MSTDRDNDRDNDAPALPPGDMPAALEGMSWALDHAHGWLKYGSQGDYTDEEAAALVRNLAAARDLLDDLEAQA